MAYNKEKLYQQAEEAIPKLSLKDGFASMRDKFKNRE